ncbi:Lipoprotein / penicillin-binding protein activator LpoB [Helicobacter sp. NHP19-012]|uniref:Penicillin-binding protein activator LpoB n=1 Tax=Helicobacter gastrofelis TaxID=2849642 RepID=A0ABM7SDC0_9HELI|nr:MULTISPECIES: penicillin-binding protein activator LpoB [unclassified Helicobacter]BCZ18395.1 Lipoprotein / penicillin-binding protein activator LpoB [Helicobacter sp. NHP19-012]GMB95677.1 Lipoprotein / penicillin-binding protein activator LpoB [Helicobacter sp. NHP22-001]
MELNKKILASCVAGALALAITGCGNGVSYASQKDLNDKKYATVGLDYQDVEDAAKTAVASMLQSPDFKQLQGKKVIQVADVINDTMQHFDTEQLTQMVLQTLKDKVQDKFYVTRVAGSQSSQDKTIEQSRKLRDNAEFNQETTQEKGTLRAPDLSLSGKVIQRNARVSSSKQRIDYIFILRLVSIKSGLELWSREFPITKLGSNKAVSW